MTSVLSHHLFNKRNKFFLNALSVRRESSFVLNVNKSKVLHLIISLVLFQMYDIKYKTMIRRFMLMDIDKDHEQLKTQKYQIVSSKVAKALMMTINKKNIITHP